MEKGVIESTAYSSCPSPAADFSLRRRYTDGANIDKAIFRDDIIPNFANQEGSLAELLGEQSDHFPPISWSAPSVPGLGPQPTSHSKSETNITPIRRTSSKRLRGRRTSSTRCNHCITPDKPTATQRIFLQDMPIELLLLIFEFAYLSPIKFPKCEHKRKSTSSYGASLPRRATANSIQQPSAPSSASPAPNNDEPPRLSDSLRIYRAKTLLYIALTCRSFNNILLDPYIDNTFWRSAARWCWDWLPSDLADVQGREISHQTSWRNLVGVFMRSENGLFKQKGGGKGGVESFGGSSGCAPAVLWKDENAKSFLESKQAQKRKLLLVCAQPGPDLFHVMHDGSRGEYTISLRLKGGENHFVTLDEYGRFGKKLAGLPGGLKRSERAVGYFPPDIFEVEGDRFQLVKVSKGRDQSTSVPSYTIPPDKHHPKPAVKEIVTWDLHCVQEYDADPSASVARCTSREGWLVFNLFTHRNHDDSALELLLDPPLDPPEDQRLFCVQAIAYPGCKPSQTENTNDGTPKETMSEKKRGKMRAEDPMPLDIEDYNIEEPTTIFRWRREFEYERANDFPASRHLHYVICNLRLNSTKAVVLIRWNLRTPASNEELVDRQFQILDLKTGNTIQVLEFPNLYWDHRHHDMSVEYNLMRHKKMSRLYNHMGPDEAMGAGNRCTRIHDDSFVLTEDKLVSGSHDYCNWVWDLNAKPSDNKTSVFTAERNDAGVADPFKVLDDFYWDEDQEEGRAVGQKKEDWNTKNERAGWWVRTPNQVMCFWHGISGSTDGRYFAACRPGKMFVWDLEAKRNTVFGFKNCESNDNDNTRWLGRPSNHVENLKYRLRNWFVWEDVLPEQGLWLLFDDLEAVYLDRDDILHACGLHGKRKWEFQRSYFTFEDEHEHSGRGRKQRDDTASEEEEEDTEYEYESDGERPLGIKRRRTNSFGAESFLGVDELFTFENEQELEYGR